LELLDGKGPNGNGSTHVEPKAQPEEARNE
jgi:hypothetical protein